MGAGPEPQGRYDQWLLLGVPDGGGLQFISNVGTGFTDAVVADLFESFAELRQASSPFGDAVPREFARRAQWVAPELVGEVEYRCVSRDGRLRHPSWRGLRPDKAPSDVSPILS